MKFIKTSISLFIIFVCFSNTSYGAEVVSFINVDKILNESNIGKNTLKKINELNNKNLKELKKEEEELKKIEIEIRNKKNVISENELANEIDSFKNKVKDLNDKKNSMVKDFNIYKKNELDNFFKKVSSIVQNYMDENSIEIIVDSKYVFMGKISSDITDKIITEINNKLK